MSKREKKGPRQRGGREGREGGRRRRRRRQRLVKGERPRLLRLSFGDKTN